MADKKYRLDFEMTDGTVQSVEFTAPQGPQGEQGPPGQIDNVSVDSIPDLRGELDGKLGTDDTAVNSQKLADKTLAEIMLMVYPVGSIYLSLSPISPETLFGGKWVQIRNRFLFGAGGIYAPGEIGGEFEHYLTVDEMPRHSHGFGYIKNAIAAGDKFARIDSGMTNVTTAFMEGAGGNQPHNNMPPYLVVYMWQRVEGESSSAAICGQATCGEVICGGV